MKIIRPFPVSDVSLVSSTVAIADANASGYWNTASAYSVGAIVQVDSGGTGTMPSVNFTASGKVITCSAAHYLYNNSTVNLTTTGTLPTGLYAGVLYYVVSGADSSNWSTKLTLGLSLTKGGAPIITTGAGTGTHTMITNSHGVVDSNGIIKIVSSHRLYECLVSISAGTNLEPRKDPTKWYDLGASNRWNIFDGSLTSQTENADSMKFVNQINGRVDSIYLGNVSASEVVISARVATQATGATTDSTGYAIGLSAITLASAGTGAISVDDVVSFAGQSTLYTVTAGDAQVSNGGTITFTPALVEAIPAAATAITVTVYGPTTYSLQSSISVSSYWSWFFEPIERKKSFVDIDLPSTYLDLEVSVTLNDTGNTVKCGALVIGLSKTFGVTLRDGASFGITDYSVHRTDDYGNLSIREGNYAERASYSVLVDRVATDSVKYELTKYRATAIVYVGSTEYESMTTYGNFESFDVIIPYDKYSICSLSVRSLT